MARNDDRSKFGGRFSESVDAFLDLGARMLSRAR